MIRLVLYALFLLPLMAGAVWLADHPGSVQMDAFGYRVETSLLVALSAILLLMVVVAVCVMLVRALIGLPQRLQAKMIVKHQRKGIDALTHTLTALASANWAEATTQLQQVSHHLGQTHPSVLLLGTQLAHAQGQKDRVRQNLSALLSSPETRLIGLRGMIEQAISDQDHKAALTYAQEAIAAQPSDRWLNLMMMDLLARSEKWDEIQTLLKKSRKHRAFSSSEADRYVAIIHLMQAREALSRGTFAVAQRQAADAYHLAPTFLPVVCVYLDSLAQDGISRRWRHVMLRAWKEEPSHELAQRVMDALAPESEKSQRKMVQKLATSQPDNAQSALLLAKLAIRQQRYDDARAALRTALSIQESAEIYRLYAEVEKATGGMESQIQEWQRRASAARAELSWQCAKCLHTQSEWTIRCNACHTFDSLSAHHASPSVMVAAEKVS